MNNKYFAYKLKSKKSLSVAWTFLAVFPHQVPELALWIFKPRPTKPRMQGLGASHPSLSKTEGAALKNQSKIYWEAVSLAVLLVSYLHRSWFLLLSTDKDQSAYSDLPDWKCSRQQGDITVLVMQFSSERTIKFLPSTQKCYLLPFNL